MPDAKCHDGDLGGFGCISSQFVDSLSFVNTKGNFDPQWFGKITRFQYEINRSSGTTTTTISEADVKVAIQAGQITSCTLLSVDYKVDPADDTIAYAEGELDIVTTGGPIPSGQYKFKHTIRRVWRLTTSDLTQ
jgi:hypothetical protein